MRGLRALAVSNSHIAEFLDGEVEKLQASHKALAHRLLQQQRELEATQSQLCATKKLIDSLQDQSSVVKIQMEELRGLMHPVRRLPVELLRAIFEATTDAVDSTLGTAIKLSHVCRQWRDIALDSPRLWNQVTITPFANSDSLWAEIIPRMKTVPASVCVQGIKKDHLSLLGKWGLSMIPNMEKLTLASPYGLAFNPQSICEALFEPPYIPLKELMIFLGVDVVGEVFYSLQMGHFPSLLTLVISGNGPIRPIRFGSEPSPTITTLILDGVDDVDMQVVLQFPQLETLKLMHVTFNEPESLEGLISQTIRIFQLIDSPLFHEPWAGSLRFPKLYSIYNDDHPHELFVAFVIAHPTVKELDCVIKEGQLAGYAAAIPAITALYLGSPFDEFLNWMETSMSSAPFPSLKVLTLAEDTTLEEFEKVVCARCLPLDHPRSRLEPPITPVDQLRVIMLSDVWAAAPLAQHELVQSASVKVVPYFLEENLYCAVLHWQSSTLPGTKNICSPASRD
jgi:F-box-like